MRPGFELGYEEDGKFYVFNHLQFNILVHPTHGEYMRARQGFKDAAVLDNIDARRMLLSRKQLLAAGASEAALGGSSSGRQLAADEKKADDKEKKDDPGVGARQGCLPASRDDTKPVALAGGAPAGRLRRGMRQGGGIAPTATPRAAGASAEQVFSLWQHRAAWLSQKRWQLVAAARSGTSVLAVDVWMSACIQQV